MLERMALLAPGWTERPPADVGVTLVEMLAYVADELSYRQDAVATEAYLDTARSRVSLRRHARLVDYRVHDGCNARAWVQIRVNATTVELPRGTPLLTPRCPDSRRASSPVSPDHADGDRRPAGGVRDRRRRRAPQRPQRDALLDLGRAGLLPPGRGDVCDPARPSPHLRAGDVLMSS